MHAPHDFFQLFIVKLLGKISFLIRQMIQMQTKPQRFQPSRTDKLILLVKLFFQLLAGRFTAESGFMKFGQQGKRQSILGQSISRCYHYLWSRMWSNISMLFRYLTRTNYQMFIPKVSCQLMLRCKFRSPPYIINNEFANIYTK